MERNKNEEKKQNKRKANYDFLISHQRLQVITVKFWKNAFIFCVYVWSDIRKMILFDCLSVRSRFLSAKLHKWMLSLKKINENTILTRFTC